MTTQPHRPVADIRGFVGLPKAAREDPQIRDAAAEKLHEVIHQYKRKNTPHV